MFARPISDPALFLVSEKVAASERISDEDAVLLFSSSDLEGVGALADIVRARKCGNVATYIRNRYINYSNVCILSCQFCAFGAKKRDEHAFETSATEILEIIRDGLADGITEIHMVGGLHPNLPGEWYLNLLRSLRELDPSLHIKAFTAVEIRHLADRVFKLSLRETLELLRAHGLDSITGGGAEIFDQSIREEICRGKETADEWLEVHRTWHEMGERSTCTMLYGHLETIAQRIDHLKRLRALQDETHGFTGFIPFAFEPDGARPMLKLIPRASIEDQLRTLAVSRVYLDNIPHVTAYWVSLGLPAAQIALNYGADDLHGTIVEEKIFHMAGSTTPQAQTKASLEKAIRDAGRVPSPRNTFYERIA